MSSDNYSPFFTGGVSGTLGAASLIFFAYIGFDAISTSSEEVKEPSRTLPRAIIGSLAIATILYILVAVVTTGLLPTDELKGQEAPLGVALTDGAGYEWAATLEDPATTYVRFVIWLAIGLVIYFAYGRSHSRLQRGEGPAAGEHA